MYLLHGKLTAKAGHRDELADILLQASQLVMSAEGCKLYVISKDYDESLKAANVRALIMKALPLIDGQPHKGDELVLLGGFGI